MMESELLTLFKLLVAAAPKRLSSVTDAAAMSAAGAWMVMVHWVSLGLVDGKDGELLWFGFARYSPRQFDRHSEDGKVKVGAVRDLLDEAAEDCGLVHVAALHDLLAKSSSCIEPCIAVDAAIFGLGDHVSTIDGGFGKRCYEFC